MKEEGVEEGGGVGETCEEREYESKRGEENDYEEEVNEE